MTSELAARFVKSYPGGAAIHADLRQPIKAFSITALFGPSGSGKTTVLRCLAGLERPDQGSIRFGEEVWFDSQRQIHRNPQQRGVGYLAQDLALFPHLTVADNIGYGLPSRGRAAKVAEIVDLFALRGLERRYPRQLSGGQQQRVALARTLVRRPRLLLLDEPLAALDAPLREQLRQELRRWLAGFGIPVVLVTHDRTEALALADQVVVMDQGRIRQSGPIQEVFNKPADPAVARLVGVETVAPGEVIGFQEGLAVVRVGEVSLLAAASVAVGDAVFVCIRAADVLLQRDNEGHTSARNRLPGRIVSMIPEGPLVRVALECGFPLTALVTQLTCREMGLAVGDEVQALLKSPAIHVIVRR